MATTPIPEGYHSVTPALVVQGAAAAIDFYTRALGATEIMRLPMPDGRGGEMIGHAEIRIGDSVVMLSDPFPDMDMIAPEAGRGRSATLMIYLDDVDAAFKRAVGAGGQVEREPENQFWGDRMGSFIDPFGHRWTLATHIEDVPPEEMPRLMEEWVKAQGD